MTNNTLNDHLKIRDGILRVTISWAALENSMARLLEHIVNRKGISLGYAIYFSVSSADARFSIVDNSIRAVFRESPLDKLVNEWSNLFDSLKNIKKQRNDITHGNICTIAVPNKKSIKNYARLTPPIFDPNKRVTNTKQLPGKSAHDIMKIADNISRLNDRVLCAVDLIDALYQRNEKTCLETLARLEELRIEQGKHNQ